MRVAISYTVEVDNDFRRAINMHYGQPGLASRENVKRWFIAHGEAASDDVMYDLQQAQERGEEP